MAYYSQRRMSLSVIVAIAVAIAIAIGVILLVVAKNKRPIVPINPTPGVIATASRVVNVNGTKIRYDPLTQEDINVLKLSLPNGRCGVFFGEYLGSITLGDRSIIVNYAVGKTIVFNTASKHSSNLDTMNYYYLSSDDKYVASHGVSMGNGGNTLAIKTIYNTIDGKVVAQNTSDPLAKCL
uniref:Uncharacterized protein n=1 Tax=viral metagenome TaxID=1070528 RepID=A0A6C0LZL2_9ZZZZ